ncbi:MAG TPA: CRISPR-associated helicase Cas3' [Thiothrix sp.]|nr:CRISPR-associated helicase Cas3' [Thiothrix sp.]
MLFSCLVDADFLDTESFMDEKKSQQRGNYHSLKDLQLIFNTKMQQLIKKAPKTTVNKIRQDILSQCRDKAKNDTGIFSLTVPTGGGKTLASMAFALDHAIEHGKNRIIYVIPYTSIIEQTANVFKDFFGEKNVIEHHSNVDPDSVEKEDSHSRLATENWDAPIIVTTTVQYFESLHAARTSRCRKLHNIANSIVILDETQLLPPTLLAPILRVIRLLSKHYNVTHILSTATQPALKTQYDPFDRVICKGLDDATEIINNPNSLYQQLERVSLELPSDFQTTTDWQTLAKELKQYDSVLVIVNRRSDARELHALMPKGTYHLSALMCAQHRSHVIDKIKKELKQGLPVKVISTQLVEAGVDMDFPVVYRAMAGLDSIAQAAGRCNREGKLKKAGKYIKGKVIVFNPPKPSIGLLGKAAQSAISLLSNYSGNPLEPKLFTDFFEHFYSKTDPDEKGINKLLTPNEKLECQFRTAAQKFQMIEEQDTKTIFVLYDKQSADYLDQLERNGPKRWLMRKLQRYTVTLYCYQLKPLLNTGDIKEVWEGFYSQNSSTLYDTKIIGLGLLTVAESPSIESFIC